MIEKQILRKAALEKRLGFNEAERMAWSHDCAQRLLGFIQTLASEPTAIAGYVSVRGEVDIMAALAALSTHHTIALPMITKDSKVLSFKHFMPGEELIEGAYGVQTPLLSAQEVTPGIVLVPLLAFDKGGHRLGYGGGYYDTTLSSFGHHPVTAIGIAFSAQQVDVIPAEPSDVRLNAVVTEKEIIRII